MWCLVCIFKQQFTYKVITFRVLRQRQVRSDSTILVFDWITYRCHAIIIDVGHVNTLKLHLPLTWARAGLPSTYPWRHAMPFAQGGCTVHGSAPAQVFFRMVLSTSSFSLQSANACEHFPSSSITCSCDAGGSHNPSTTSSTSAVRLLSAYIRHKIYDEKTTCEVSM